MRVDDKDSQLRQIRTWAGDGRKLSWMAKELGYKTTSGVTNFLKRNDVGLREELRESNSTGQPPVSKEEAIRRLRLLVNIEAIGITAAALATWGRNNCPNGAAEALEDYLD